MTTREETPRSRKVDEIIRSRGEIPSEFRPDGGNDEYRYQAAIVTIGFPQMGFSVFCNNGQRHGFFYHNLENLDLVEGQHGAYLRFTHRGKAATLRGANLHDMFQAIMDHTLQAIYEYSEAIYPPVADDEPVITRIRIDDLNAKVQRAGGNDEETH